MRKLFLAVLLAGSAVGLTSAIAAGGCGPGCHVALYGGCVVDGWGVAPVSPVNECPAGIRTRPPCPYGYVWRSRYRACFAAN